MSAGPLIFGMENVGKMAGVTGLEPAASGVTGQRSNQLSYTPATLKTGRHGVIHCARYVNNDSGGSQQNSGLELSDL
jgi:hypothetical protein